MSDSEFLIISYMIVVSVWLSAGAITVLALWDYGAAARAAERIIKRARGL